MRSVIEAIRAFEPNFRGARRALINPLFVALFCALFIAGARAEEDAAPVRAQATGFTDQGYGRLLLTFSQETKAEVAWSVSKKSGFLLQFDIGALSSAEDESRC